MERKLSRAFFIGSDDCVKIMNYLLSAAASFQDTAHKLASGCPPLVSRPPDQEDLHSRGSPDVSFGISSALRRGGPKHVS